MGTPIFKFVRPVQRLQPVPRASRRPGEAPRVGVIYNPCSHRNKGADFDCKLTPLVHIAQPGDRSQLPVALAEFAHSGLDLLVINGGDGTVRDVLTCGMQVFGDNWPAIAVLPKGKTNALTVDLGLPLEWSLQDAIDAYADGTRVYRRPLDIVPVGEGPQARVLGFIMGAGAYTTATEAGQRAHRLGAFNSLAVGITVAWGVLQCLFAGRSNAWRRGAKMAIGLGAQNAPMSHSGLGDPAWRQIICATTLEAMPAGIWPFGPLRQGLKIAATDQISRRSLPVLVGMMRGKSYPNMRRKGFHQIGTTQFTLAIDEAFVLDGEAFPGGHYRVGQGPDLEFVAP